MARQRSKHEMDQLMVRVKKTIKYERSTGHEITLNEIRRRFRIDHKAAQRVMAEVDAE